MKNKLKITKSKLEKYKKFDAKWKKEIEQFDLNELNYSIQILNDQISQVKAKIESSNLPKKTIEENGGTFIPGTFTGDVWNNVLQLLKKDLQFVKKTKRNKEKN